jgi:Spy/CpxP family protein refolding chaperone
MIRTRIPSVQAIRRGAARAVMTAVLLGAQALASQAAAGGPHPMSSDTMLSHMTSQLNLTDAQAQQIKQVLDSRQVQMTAQGEALKTARGALRQAVAATPFNEAAIRSAATAIGQAEGDAAVLRAQVHAQILPLLNADQQQKFATFGEGRHSGWKSHTSDPAD